jgi:phosphoribosylanthranilate isomerase
MITPDQNINTSLHSPLSAQTSEATAIKVCGMRHAENIQNLVKLKLNYIGFIFYRKSKRFARNLNPSVLSQIPPHIYKVGVFVDEAVDIVIQTANKYQLQYVQLHGAESPEYCQQLYNNKIKIIKAVSITPHFDFGTILQYQAIVQFFLFDTASPHKGGSGHTFNWSILENYQGKTPFFLAGGIDEQNFAIAKNIKHPQLFGLDLNSCFELEPGLKNIELLKKILTPNNSQLSH